MVGAMALPTVCKPLVVCLLGTALMVVAGCGTRFSRVDVAPGEIPNDLRLPDPDAVVRVYQPASITVYPLSRLEGAGDARRAVVHVQLLDAFGHDIKWPGVVQLTLTAVDGNGELGTHWVNLTGGESNAKAYDSISRCYIVRVPAPGKGPVRVRARWVMDDENGRPVGLDGTSVLGGVK